MIKRLQEKSPWFGKFCHCCGWIRGFLVFGYWHFEYNKCLTGAAALTYVSLFAIVPLITVSYVAFSFFPSYRSLGMQVEEFLFQHFLPDTSADLVAYLKSFANQAKNLTWFGVIFLIFSVQMMLKNIEDNLNAIWGVRRRPRGIVKLVVYWLILSIGPLLLGVTLALSTYVFSLHLFGGISESKAIKTLLGLAPFLLTFDVYSNGIGFVINGWTYLVELGSQEIELFATGLASSIRNYFNEENEVLQKAKKEIEDSETFINISHEGKK